MKQYSLVIGPIDDDPDGLSPEDLKECLEAAGWRDVRVEWLDAVTEIERLRYARDEAERLARLWQTAVYVEGVEWANKIIAINKAARAGEGTG
jgi:hypothetical protein